MFIHQVLIQSPQGTWCFTVSCGRSFRNLKFHGGGGAGGNDKKEINDSDGIRLTTCTHLLLLKLLKH